MNRLSSLSPRAILEQTECKKPTHVSEFLLNGRDPTRTALQTLEGDYTYGQLQNASLAVAGYLLSQAP